MTFYDDAELAAVAAIRGAVAEFDSTEPRSVQIHAVTMRLYEQHGSDGIAAIVAVMARWLASQFYVNAEREEKPLDQYLDEWELSTVEAHVADEDEF